MGKRKWKAKKEVEINEMAKGVGIKEKGNKGNERQKEGRNISKTEEG